MRIPYAPNAPLTEESRRVYERIAVRRAPRPLIPLDLALLHNPAIADGYSSLLGAIRTQSSLPDALMELAICHVAVLTGAVYEWKSHSVLALRAGVSADKLERLLRGETRQGFDELEVAVLDFTKDSTIRVEVRDAVFHHLKTLLGSDKRVMELVMTVAAYNMVSRFLVGLDVTESNGGRMEVPNPLE